MKSLTARVNGLHIEQCADARNRQTVVRIERLTVPVPDVAYIRAGRPPAALALDAFYDWIGRYGDFVQPRFMRVI